MRMAFEPTLMQKKAIETKGNVLVSAAAGSGKTAVLVERVINMLTDKISPISADRLLIVTFTNAAAAEMRKRIEKRLYEEIKNNPDDIHLQKQRYLLNNADICTIDSFCIKLVRENFEKCGVEPDFKVGDDSEFGNSNSKIMTELIAEYLENPSKEFSHLLELTNCEYDEKNLTEYINKIYRYSQQLPFPENFINSLSLPYEIPFTVGNAWYDMAFDMAEKRIKILSSCLEKMENSAALTEKNTEKYITYAENISIILQQLYEAFESKDWDNLVRVLSVISLERVPSGNKDDINANIFKENQKKLKELINQLRKIFYAEKRYIQDYLNQNIPSVKLLIKIIAEYGKRLLDNAIRENTFNFYNIEQFALNLLCEYKNGNIEIKEDARHLCLKYDEVLVDEFQDVNDLQNTLFYVLSDCDKKLFVVGDVKQSIYGFRGSNPDNFIKKKNEYKLVNNANENDSKKIILSDNFRSRKGICDAANYFFSILMGGQFGSIIYDDEEKLNASGKFAENNVAKAELLAIDTVDADNSYALLECEAQKIAEYIISVMNEGEIISEGDKLRNARFSDFVILLDKVKDKANVLARILSTYDIPVALGNDSFLESTEISIVMSLLQVIDNPKCDVELLSVMMSPIFGFSAENMAKIRANKKTGSLYSAVEFYGNNGDKKTIEFLQKLTSFRYDAAVLPLDRLVSKLIYSSDIFNIMSSLEEGNMRKANLFTFIKFAKNYTERTNGGIYGFLKYMKALPQTAFKVTASGADNAVKIMSMHNSKGLQFPVCIIANLSSQINNADSISRTLFSEKGGIAFKYYDESYHTEIEMLGHMCLAEIAHIKTVEEKLRLLYVAMTRAVDRLVLVTSAKDLENKLNKLSLNLSDKLPYVTGEFLENSRNMGDWILSCALLCSEKLCQYANVKFFGNCSDILNVKILNKFDNICTLKNNQPLMVSYDEKTTAQIKANAEFVYPYESLRHLQAKASVSEIVHKTESDKFAFEEKPAFIISDDKLSGAEKGTVMHRVMQFINLEKKVDITSEIERLLEWKFITETEAKSVDIYAIEKFLKSKLYQRIISSQNIYRELRFLTEISVNHLKNSFETEFLDENIIVQGAIDLCFIEEDGVVIIDFKTDKINNLSELVNSYGEQLEIYSVAAQKIFKKPVKEKIIYSFFLGESISFKKMDYYAFE